MKPSKATPLVEQIAADAAAKICRHHAVQVVQPDIDAVQSAIEKATEWLQRDLKHLGMVVREMQNERDTAAQPQPRKATPRGAWDWPQNQATPRGDLLELAWGIIANAGGGDWERESKEWQDAAVGWRDQYFGSLPKVSKESSEQPNAHVPPATPREIPTTIDAPLDWDAKPAPRGERSEICGCQDGEDCHICREPASGAASGECQPTGGSSRMCERGTKTCEVRHEGAASGTVAVAGSEPRIYTRCPACFNDTLTINKGHLLCTWHKCPDPTLIDSAKPSSEPPKEERGETPTCPKCHRPMNLANLSKAKEQPLK